MVSTRPSLQLLLAAFLWWALVSASTAELSVAAEPKLLRGIQAIDDAGVASNISPGGQAATVLFDNLIVGSFPGTKMPLVVTRTKTITLPMTGNDQPVGLTYDIRGFVSTQPSTRAALVVHSCDQTVVVDLVKAIADAKAPSTPQPKAKRTKPAAMEMADDFYVRLNVTVPANATNSATFLLLVQKDQDIADTGAALYVDSLDIEICSTEAK